MKRIHVVPTWNGKWAVLDEDSREYKLWERYYPTYYALIGRFLKGLPWMWRQ